MAITSDDRAAICELIALHGHLMDDGDLARLEELFTADVTYDLEDFGLGVLHGVAAIRDAALAMGAANPIGHHVTNLMLTELDAETVRVRSKGIGIKADGTSGSVIYEDTVRRTGAGWRIGARKVIARRAALDGRTADTA
jgi:3-phenylpropionate/cinnamic acid dioxygenase small subunit